MYKIFRKVVKRLVANQRIQAIAGKGAVLAYHRIVPDPLCITDFSPNVYITTSLSDFRNQVEYLAKNYHVLSMDQFYEAYISNSLPAKVAVITFDDGYFDNVELALPILEEFQLPATIFITAGFVTGQFKPWWLLLEKLVKNVEELSFSWQGKEYSWKYTDNKMRIESMYKIRELYLSSNKEQFLGLSRLLFSEIADIQCDEKIFVNEAELKSLSKHPLITIGAHTLTHPALNRFSDSDLQEELEKSKSWLEVTLGKSVDYVAYPYGDHSCVSERVFWAAKKAGYKAAFTTQAEQIDYGYNLFGFPRVCIDCFDNHVNFLWKMNGYYSFREKRAI